MLTILDNVNFTSVQIVMCYIPFLRKIATDAEAQTYTEIGLQSSAVPAQVFVVLLDCEELHCQKKNNKNDF